MPLIVLVKEIGRKVDTLASSPQPTIDLDVLADLVAEKLAIRLKT